MSDLAPPELAILEFEGRLLTAWEADWQPLSGGFLREHPELRSVVGLMRAVLNGTIMYIMRATEHNGGGIEKGLQRIRGPVQTGNSGYGARMVRSNIDWLELEVLILGSDAVAAERAIKLKRLMIKTHDPEWNRAHRRRIADLAAGNLRRS